MQDARNLAGQMQKFADLACNGGYEDRFGNLIHMNGDGELSYEAFHPTDNVLPYPAQMENDDHYNDSPKNSPSDGGPSNEKFVHKVRTTYDSNDNSNEDRTFVALYELGQNTATLKLNMKGQPDDLTVFYGEGRGENAVLIEILSTSYTFERLFTLQDYTEVDLTGRDIYIRITSNPSSGVTAWTYTFDAPGANFVGSNYNFLPLQIAGFNIVNWLVSRSLY